MTNPLTHYQVDLGWRLRSTEVSHPWHLTLVIQSFLKGDDALQWLHNTAQMAVLRTSTMLHLIMHRRDQLCGVHKIWLGGLKFWIKGAQEIFLLFVIPLIIFIAYLGERCQAASHDVRLPDPPLCPPLTA